jgi:hypothetical protein
MVDVNLEKNSDELKGAKVLLFFAIFLLALSAAAYFVLDDFSKKNKIEIASLEASLNVFNSEENILLEKEVLAGKTRIDNFSRLITEHLNTSKVFGIIEGATHPKVWFKGFSFDSREGRITVSGEADNFEALGQQIIILENKENIIQADVSSISVNKEGRIGFGLSISIPPDILKMVIEE